MFKKAIAALILSTAITTVYADDKVEPKANENIVKVITELTENYEAPKLTDVEIEYQTEAIKKIDELYFDKENYNQEELNELFVNFITIGLNGAADHILNNENFKLNIEGYNEKGITPLIAAAMSNIEGGNVEYAVKLIKLGADVNKGARGSNISPTSFTAITNNYKVLAVLIASDAKFMKEDLLDYRPIDYAIANNSEESASVLANALSARVKMELEKEPSLK